MTSFLNGRNPRVVLAAGVIIVLGLAAYTIWPSPKTTKVTAEFTRAVGLFPGSEVRILGVKVGQVDSVTPVGDHVQVVFEYAAKYKAPVDAKAAVVAPSLVSDRYVQLLPVYRGGAALTDGARIGLDRTAVPVELDRISSSVDDLMTALGPKGANSGGALSRFVDTSAANLDGQGQNLHDTIRGLSQAVTTFSESRGDLFGTVTNLQSFTSMLAGDDTQVRRLNTDLSTVSQQLEGEKGDLQAALKNLAIALSEVSTFVKDNRTLLTTDVAKLTSVSSAIASKRDALAETLTNAPVALSNLQLAYNPVTGTLDTRDNPAQALKDPALLLCSLIDGPTGTANSPVCKALTTLLGNLPTLPSAPGLGLPSAVPGALTRSRAVTGTSTTPAMRGADPTLGGLLKETP
ncbi:MAG: MCE family protein [Nostocoides sp.]